MKKILLIALYSLMAPPIYSSYSFSFSNENLVNIAYCRAIFNQLNSIRKDSKTDFDATVYPQLGQLFNAIEESKNSPELAALLDGGNLLLWEQSKIQAFALIHLYLGAELYYTILEPKPNLPDVSFDQQDESLDGELDKLRVAVSNLCQNRYQYLGEEVAAILRIKYLRIWLRLSGNKEIPYHLAKAFLHERYKISMTSLIEGEHIAALTLELAKFQLTLLSLEALSFDDVEIGGLDTSFFSAPLL